MEPTKDRDINPLQPEQVKEPKGKKEKKDKTLKRKDATSTKSNVSTASTTEASSTQPQSKTKEKNKGISYKDKAKFSFFKSSSKSTNTNDPSEKDEKLIKSKKAGKSKKINTNENENLIKAQLDKLFSTANNYVETNDKDANINNFEIMRDAIYDIIKLSKENKQIIVGFVSSNPNKVNDLIINFFKSYDYVREIGYDSFYRTLPPFIQLYIEAGHKFNFVNIEDLLLLKEHLKKIDLEKIDNGEKWFQTVQEQIDLFYFVEQLPGTKSISEWEEKFLKIPTDQLGQFKEQILSSIKNLKLNNPDQKYSFKINDKEEVAIPKELISLQLKEFEALVKDSGVDTTKLDLISKIGDVVISDDAKKQFLHLLMGDDPGPKANKRELILLADLFGVEWIKQAYLTE